MADLVGYEEKLPEVVSRISTGYPRFVCHPDINRACEIVRRELNLGNRVIALVGSKFAADDLVQYLHGMDASVHAVDEDAFFAVDCASNNEANDRVRLYLQHTGVRISSRQAEDFIKARSNGTKLSSADPAPTEEALEALNPFLPRALTNLTSSGMNAVLTAIHAARDVQRPRGRRSFIQLGWLYLDTQRILEKLLLPDEELIVLPDVHDKDAIQRTLASRGNDTVALITELPTNPLVQFADSEWLAQACADRGVIRIFDPSLLGVAAIDVLPDCDILVTSLTKYAGWTGDLMIGAICVNPQSPFADAILSAIAERRTPPYYRDAARLAELLPTMAKVNEHLSRNARQIADYLARHTAIGRLFRPDAPENRSTFERLQRTADAFGAVISFELKGGVAGFYDHARVPKGPGFGTRFTLLCPFMYLAHYNLVSNQMGRRELEAHGIDPELMRLSVGGEPTEQIIAALESGLQHCREGR